MHPAIRAELNNLYIQFGNKAVLTLDDYAKLYSIKRKYASQHLHRRKIPVTKEGRSLYVSTLDLAIYRAKRKNVNEPLITDIGRYIDMRQFSGFSRMADRRDLED